MKPTPRLPRNSIARVRDYVNEQGVYEGPSTWSNFFNADSIPKLVSLGSLEVCGDSTSFCGSPVAEMPNLRKVEFFLHIQEYAGSLPKLEEVNHLVLGEQLRKSIPKLGIVYGSIRIVNQPVPFLPSLIGDCIIAWRSVSVEITSGGSRNVDLGAKRTYTYNLLRDKVLSTPVEDLLTLRSSLPILTHLINARLRGDLK